MILDTEDSNKMNEKKFRQSPKTARNTFLLNTHRIFTKMDHIPSHKANLNQVQQPKINYNAIKVEINY